MNNSPDWITNYRKRIEKSKRLFYEKIDRPFVSRDAERKYTAEGEPRSFHGWSLVYFLPAESELIERLSHQKKRFHESLQAAGIVSKFAFLPISTYHVTIIGIATNKSIAMQASIVSGVNQNFKLFRKNITRPPRIRVRGDFTHDGSTIIAPIEPVDEESLNTLYHIRSDVRRRLHPLGEDIVRNTPHNFHGHLSIAYLIQQLNEIEYAKLKEILHGFSHARSIGEADIKRITLRRFDTMVDWGKPIATLILKTDNA